MSKRDGMSTEYRIVHPAENLLLEDNGCWPKDVALPVSRLVASNMDSDHMSHSLRKWLCMYRVMSVTR